MAKILLATDGQKLIKIESPKIASGDKNADYLCVNCCPSWDGFTKTAVFYRTEDEIYYALLDINNECVIPWEVLQTEGLLYLGIFGEKDDIRQTTEVVSYKIDKGAIVDDLKPSDPTPDIYDQIIAQYAEVVQFAENADNNAKAAKNTIDAHLENKSNPHAVTKSQVGLGNVDNTSDENKPVSTAQATAIAEAKKAGTDAQTNLTYHTNNKNNPHGVTAEQVGARSNTWLPTLADIGAASADSIGTNKVFNKLTDLGIITFPTTMKTVANSMPNNSTLMLDSRDITAGSTYEISDLGMDNAGMYMIMRGNSNARVIMLHIYGATGATTSYLDFGCYAATNDEMTWIRGNRQNATYPDCRLQISAEGTSEWINPPMAAGTEYRTTERFLGKPVYIKMINCGGGPNNTIKSIEHGASNAVVFDFGGLMYHSDGSVSIPWQTYSTLSVNSTRIEITTTANYSSYSCFVWIKYYKPTD